MKSPLSLVLAVLLAAAVGDRSASGQSALYVANTTTATSVSGTVHFLQVVDLNLNQGPGTYNINSFTIGFYFTTLDAQSFRLVFYSGVNTDPNAADALAGATVIGATSGDDDPPGIGTYSLTYYYNTPFSITIPDSGVVGVEFILTDSAGNYSSTTNGRFTASAPSVGTAAGFVWNDADLNNTFAGSEQTRFGMANANTRFAVTGTLVTPAPRVKTYTRSGTTATLTVDSYNGVSYQLQRATSLTAGDWTNVGGAVAGTTGSVLTFTDADGTDPAAFYRVVAALSGQSGSNARNVLRIKG